jgi:hypothetical protein
MDQDTTRQDFEKAEAKAALDAKLAAPAAQRPPRPYVPMTMREVKTRVITRAELEAGYAVTGPDGATVRRDYVVVAYVVEDPDPS